METRESTRSDRTGKIRGDNEDESKNERQDWQDEKTDLLTHTHTYIVPADVSWMMRNEEG